MSEDRSLIAYEYWRDSSQRFDYFITGLIGALVAFIAQSYSPSRLGLPSSSIELLALLFLILSFICAFKRIEILTDAFRIMTISLEAIKGIIDAQSKSLEFEDLKTGEIYLQGTFEAGKKKYRSTADSANKLLKEHSKKAKNLYKWRNYLLLFGFILLLVARISKAY